MGLKVMCLASVCLQEVLEAAAPKEPHVVTLPYVDKERAKQREEKALKVGDTLPLVCSAIMQTIRHCCLPVEASSLATCVHV